MPLAAYLRTQIIILQGHTELPCLQGLRGRPAGAKYLFDPKVGEAGPGRISRPVRLRVHRSGLRGVNPNTLPFLDTLQGPGGNGEQLAELIVFDGVLVFLGSHLLAPASVADGLVEFQRNHVAHVMVELRGAVATLRI